MMSVTIVHETWKGRVGLPCPERLPAVGMTRHCEKKRGHKGRHRLGFIAWTYVQDSIVIDDLSLMTQSFLQKQVEIARIMRDFGGVGTATGRLPKGNR
jgi:hypothetical protein